MRRIFLIFGLCLLSAMAVQGTSRPDAPTAAEPNHIFVAINGSDSNPGTLTAPLASVAAAVSKVFPGDTIFVRGGVYPLDAMVAITTNGEPEGRIVLSKHRGDARPVFDFSAQPRRGDARGFELRADYWTIYGIDIRLAGDNGLYISGSNNLVEFSTFSENNDSGLQLGQGASNNLILNCDSFYNSDPREGNADGFAYKMDVGGGNLFSGCRSYNNSDDGWDGYLRGTSGDMDNAMVNCWAFCNGYRKNGDPGQGDGNGFKTGGYDPRHPLAHNVSLDRCIAAHNRVNGFDRNSNKGRIVITNCSSEGNGRNNFSFPTGKDPEQFPGKQIIIQNSISINGPEVFVAGPIVCGNNSWQTGKTYTESDFESLDYKQLYRPRKADGSLPDITYLQPKAGGQLMDTAGRIDMSYYRNMPEN
ncbi:MAG: right-handed parallel beta-helix repeat-containing protein [Rikenellaceae bacterium]|jgi:hypothetical protein|nr:right-handed parallel beta-helix repeat-containing protein [Rikenellaceae bacterium]